MDGWQDCRLSSNKWTRLQKHEPAPEEDGKGMDGWYSCREQGLERRLVGEGRCKTISTKCPRQPRYGT